MRTGPSGPTVVASGDGGGEVVGTVGVGEAVGVGEGLGVDPGGANGEPQGYRAMRGDALPLRPHSTPQ